MRIYHTETQADYDALMIELERQGCKWSFDRKLSEVNRWHVDEHLTCLRVYDSKVNHASLNYYKEEYPYVPITKYKAKADEKMKFTKENVEKVIDEYFLQADFESCGDLIAEIRNLDDTPEKVVVPKFVADYLEDCKKRNIKLVSALCHFKMWYGKEIELWFDNEDNNRLFALAWSNGYEVEKEPLYRIELPAYDFDMTEKINHPYSIFLGQNIETGATAHYVAPKPHTDIKMLFTEAEIKAIDKRYWPFAVPAND